jgi:LPXTG-motif cell wall-anchored protein
MERQSMKKLRLALAVAVVAFIAVVAPSPAQAYPIESCNITNPGEVDPGEDFTVTVTMKPDNIASDFKVTYGDQTHTANNVSSTQATFEADEDDTLVSATVTGGDPVTSVSCSSDVDFDSDDDDGDGDGGGILPNTGGERLLWLIIGGLLVLVGGGVVISSRRRDA